MVYYKQKPIRQEKNLCELRWTPPACAGKLRRNMAPPPPKPDPADTLLQLLVTLGGSRPAIWRRLLVPADLKLSGLHTVLQTAMGWEESHLHCFRHAGTTYEPKAERQLGDFFLPKRSKDETKVRLADLLRVEGDWLVYEYDFGDSWEHEVRVEKILPAPPGSARHASCQAGERACPPEDCGGLPGFEHLLKVMANRKHSEHREMLDWLGERFDPKNFNAARVNAVLLKLKL
jgi:hypothetical protein